MRLQYGDEFDLDVRFTLSGGSSMASGEPRRALPATAQGGTCGHRETGHTCETKCQEASCEPHTCRTCDTQCDQRNTCGDTCPLTACNTCGNTCQGATCPPTRCDTCPPTCQGATCVQTCQGATCGNTCQGTTCPPTQCDTCPGSPTCYATCNDNVTCDCHTRNTCAHNTDCGSCDPRFPNCQPN